MLQSLPALRDLAADHVDPSFQERPIGSRRRCAEAKGLTGGGHVIEAEDHAGADRATRERLPLRDRNWVDPTARHRLRAQPRRDALLNG